MMPISRSPAFDDDPRCVNSERRQFAGGQAADAEYQEEELRSISMVSST